MSAQKKTKSTRLFVAAYVPHALAGKLLKELRALSLPSHRETPVEQIHLTLQFIGPAQPNETPTIIESVQRSASGLPVFELTPKRLITLPPKGRPRLVAAETDAPSTLLELQKRLAGRLSRNPRKNTADRFTPHLTLCRFKLNAKPFDVDHPINFPSFTVQEITLVKSTLTPQGPIHAAIETIPLNKE